MRDNSEINENNPPHEPTSLPIDVFSPDEAFISSDFHDGNEFTVTQLNQVSTSKENILTKNNSEINEDNLPHEPTGTSLSIDVSIY